MKFNKWSAYSRSVDHDLHLPEFRLLAIVLERWSPMGQFVIDNWVGYPMGHKKLTQTNVEINISVGLGRGVEIVEGEERYIDMTRPRLELKRMVWGSCAAAMCQLT